MNIILREWNHYQTLPLKSRLLMISFTLRSIASPLLSLFINSFIWRSTSSLPDVVIYNVGFFVLLPLGFYVNGLMLKRIKIARLYLVGLIVSAVSIVVTVFFSGSSVWNFFAYGGFYGFGAGIYWANRNFLSFQEAKSQHRNYFYSIASLLNSLISLIVTFLVGWLIVLGEGNGLYTPTTAYWVLSLLAMIVLIYSGMVVLKTDYVSPKVNKIIQFHISPKWNKVRLISFAMGILEGIGFFLPTLLILFYLGEEGVLGTISTIVTLFVVVITYLYGRLAKHNHRKPVYFVSLSSYIIFSVLLLLLEHPLNILIFVLFSGITTIFQWLTIEPLVLDIMDDESNEKLNNQYMYIFDKELFLNIGRISSVLILLFIIQITSQKTGLLMAPLAVGICQLVLMVYILRKSKF
ncbi:MAG: MFS transporter [Patescibacteria group bacterium]